MTNTLTGGCACGAVRFKAPAPPRFAMICQCRACQQMTGGAHAPQAAVDRDGFDVAGTLTAWTRTGDSGNTVTRYFCPVCGSPIYSTTPRMPDGIVLLAGALDDPAAVTPTMLVYSENALPWDHARIEPAS